MKTVWTLTVTTSLPDTCAVSEDLETVSEVFETFVDAKNKMKEVIKELAFSENAMFDGNGYLVQFDNYISDRESIEEDSEADLEKDALSGLITSSFLKELHECFRDAFCGEKVVLNFPNAYYSDGFIAVEISGDTVNVTDDYDGYINGIVPKIETNIFDMTDEKDYRLHIDDLFGGFWGQEASAELYIDLKKTVSE